MDNLGVATTWLCYGAIFCNKGLSPTDLFYYRNYFELEIKIPRNGVTFVTQKMQYQQKPRSGATFVTKKTISKSHVVA